MVGLRGVGKTVLLNRMRTDAESAGIHTLLVEAPETRSLPAILAPELRLALLRLSINEQARDLARRALRGLAGFAKALRVKYDDIQVGLDLDPEPGLADNGDLTLDLQALLEASGRAASKAGTALALFVDEIQYVPEEQLAALITALHRGAQQSLPVVLVGWERGCLNCGGVPERRSRTRNVCLISRKSARCQRMRHVKQFCGLRKSRTRALPMMRSSTLSRLHTAIPIFYRSGVSTLGMLRTRLQLRLMTHSKDRKALWRRWTKAFSGYVLTA